MARRKKKDTPANGESEWTYKDWYDRNKEALSARRRARYQEDRKYREKVLAQNKEYRDKKNKERTKRVKTKVRIPKHRKPVSLSIKVGSKFVVATLVHVGTFARAISRSVPTVHQWERLGLLPRTPYHVEGKCKRERLYTADQILVVKKALETRGSTVSSSDPTFYQEILEGWEATGAFPEEK